MNRFTADGLVSRQPPNKKMSETKSKYDSKSNNRKRYQATAKDMQELAPRVLEIVKQHQGKASAITARKIADELMLFGKNDDRRVRMIIRELIVEHKQFIGASDNVPRGFWWIATVEEWREYLETLRVDIFGSWARYHVIAKLGAKEFGVPIQPIDPNQLGFSI